MADTQVFMSQSGGAVTKVPMREVEAPDVRRARVLLVEDDIDVGDMYALALEKGGFLVERAATALEALAVGRSLTCEVIVLDIGLPDRSGIDVLAELGT